MVSLEELKQTREKEAKEYGKYYNRIIENQVKSKIKEDIKKIRAAKLRARFGITNEKLEKTGKFVKGFGSGLGSGLKKMGKLAMALGDSANEYQKQQDKKFGRR